MQSNFNKSKIIATIGPASSSIEVLEKLIRAGVDVCRINASHGNHESQTEVLKNLRKLNMDNKFKIPVLYDLQGPKMRIGEVENNKVFLEDGSLVILTVKECMGTAGILQIQYPMFHHDVQVGDSVLVDDGKIELQVIEKSKSDSVTAKVIHGGDLSSRKGINLPYTKISLPSLTEKDKKDLEFALSHNVEWIGLSFVRSAKDIIDLKKIIIDAGNSARVVAKIEKPEAIRDIDNIIMAADGIMVARGDLGVEIPPEKVPAVL